MRHPSCLSSRFTTFPKCFFFGLYHHDPGPPSSPRPIDGADSTVTYWNYASDSLDVPRRIYLLRDHLGSVRVAADSAGKALLVHHYYPYGGDLTLNVSNIQEPGIPAGGLDPLDPGIFDPLDPIFIDPEEPIETQLPPENPYRFIGKETAGGDGLVLYDFGARYYTPSIPQWTTMDPLSEKYYSLSPYVYCVGDPMHFVDPNGTDWYSYYDEDKERKFKYEDHPLTDTEMKRKGYVEYLGQTTVIDGRYYSLFGKVLALSDSDPTGDLYRAIDNLIIKYIHAITWQPKSAFDQEEPSSITDFSTIHISRPFSFVYQGDTFSSMEDGTLFFPIGTTRFRGMVIQGEPYIQIHTFPTMRSHGIGGAIPTKNVSHWDSGRWLIGQSTSKRSSPLQIRFDEKNAEAFITAINQLFKTSFTLSPNK